MRLAIPISMYVATALLLPSFAPVALAQNCRPLPDATIGGTRAGAAGDGARVQPRVEVSRKEARWAGPGNDFLSDTSSTWFVISGDVHNTGTAPVGYVKLLYELIDDAGTAVASEHGFNLRAEDLRLPAYEAGTISRADLHIQPVQPGESDSFRMMFIRSEVPSFKDWRVRVLEVGRE